MNKLLLQNRLALIKDYLFQMKRLEKKPKEVFWEDKDLVAAAESYLRRSLEAIFDIGRHIVAKTGGTELSSEYKSIAKGLGDRGIVSQELQAKLLQMAGYRNRLVHLYHMIDSEELYEILRQDLADIENFVIEINDYINQNH